MTEDTKPGNDVPIEEEQAQPEASGSEAEGPKLDASMEALFAAAVEGQDRLESEKKGDSDEVEVEIDASQPEESYEGPRGADPREIHQRMQTLVKEQSEKIMDLESKLEEDAGQIEALRDRLIRNQADAENFRKRMTREREEQVKFGNEKFIREMLSILDNLELALGSEKEIDGAKLAEGVTMIHDQLVEHLKKYGVEAVDSVGQPFDPNYHEAFQQFQTDAVPPGCVAQQYQKGYLMFGRLLRPARVGVAIAPEGAQSPEEKDGTEPENLTPDSTSNDNGVGA